MSKRLAGPRLRQTIYSAPPTLQDHRRERLTSSRKSLPPLRSPAELSGMVLLTDVVQRRRERAERGSGQVRDRGNLEAGQDVGVNSYAVGRRRPVSTFVEKEGRPGKGSLVPAQAVTRRFAPQRRNLFPRFFVSRPLSHALCLTPFVSRPCGTPLHRH